LTKQLLIPFAEKPAKDPLLNPEQKRAVETIDGPVMVVAGPGTGKTQVLASRIAHILKTTDTKAANILCLTFSESGATAMRTRLLDMIGTEALAIGIYTYHGFCNDVIQSNLEEFPELGFEATQLSDVEKIELCKEIISEFPEDSPLRPLNEQFTYVRTINKVVSAIKKEGISPEQYELLVEDYVKFMRGSATEFEALSAINYTKLSENDILSLVERLGKKFPGNPLLISLQNLIDQFNQENFDTDKARRKGITDLRAKFRDFYRKYSKADMVGRQQELANAYATYAKKIQDQKKYDYEDMIMSVVQKFQSNTELLRDYQERFQYILVDEYQDTNNAQNQLLMLLADYFETPNIFAVGDDDQSIYRFQGASLENMLLFYNKYKPEVITLTENHRSQQLILDAADELISRNTFRISDEIPGVNKHLQAVKTYPPVKLKLTIYKSELQEAVDVAKQIQELLKKEIPAKEIAVLYRTHKDAELVLTVFEKMAIPYHLDTGENIVSDKYVKQLLGIFAWLTDTGNDPQLYKILCYEFLKLPSLDLFKLSRYSYEHRILFADLLADSAALKNLKLQQPEKLNLIFAKLLELAKSTGDEEDPVYLTEQVINLPEFGFLKSLLGSAEQFKHLRRITRLVNELKHLSRVYKNYSIKRFLQQLNEYQDYGLTLQDKLAEIENSVLLSTAHKSKGLEFQYVFVIKLNRSNWEKQRGGNSLEPVPGIVKTGILGKQADEERRLLYVAITRAKLNAFLSYAQFDANERSKQPSELLSAITTDKLEVADKSMENLQSEDLLRLVSPPAVLDMNESIRDYLNVLVQNYRMSASNLSSYLECPRCFFYRTILRIPEIRQPYFDYGTAVHAALRDLFLELKTTEKLPGAEYLLTRFRLHLQKSNMSHERMQHYLHEGNKVLERYFLERSNTFAAESLVEYGFGGKWISVNDVPLTGKIDRIDFLDEHSIKVIDYKTSDPTRARSELKPGRKYHQQLTFYKLLIDNDKSKSWQVSSAGIEFLQPDAKDKLFNPEIKITDADSSQLVETITEVYAKIKQLEFADCGKNCDTEWLHELPWIL
jgi:DNA helicase-2/ATP-dependent DNA helicase PcrA